MTLANILVEAKCHIIVGSSLICKVYTADYVTFSEAAIHKRCTKMGVQFSQNSYITSKKII